MASPFPPDAVIILTEEDAQKLSKIAHIAELVNTARLGGKRLSEVSPNAQRFIRARLDDLERDFVGASEESAEAMPSFA